MKRQNIALLIGMICTLFACTEDYSTPYPVSDVAWYTSKPTLRTYAVSKNEMMGFIDASQGTLTHRWEIEEGSHFLKSDVAKGDSLPLFIDHETGLVSNEKGVNVLFANSGHYSVRLYNTFSEEVISSHESQRGSIQLSDGTWAFDTTMTVDVYEEVHAAFKVCRVKQNDAGEIVAGEVLAEVGAERNPADEDPTTWPSYSVEVGERLMFIDLTNDPDKSMVQPNVCKWTISNKKDVTSTYNDSVAIVYFNEFGLKKTGIGSLKASRNVTGIPSSSSQKQIPIKLEVKQSSQPFTYADGAIWTSPTSLMFNVSGEVSTKPENAEDNFTVHVVNTNSNLSKNIKVTNMTFDPSNASVVTLELEEEIYSDDVVTVAYTQSDDHILSFDMRPLQSFEAKTVAFPAEGENVFKDNPVWAGFEGTGPANAGYAADYWVSNKNADTQTWVRTAGDGIADKGDAYMKYTGPIQNPYALFGMGFGANANTEAGTYRVSHRIFIEEGTTIEVLKTDIGQLKNNWTVEVTMKWNLKDLPRGEWVTISQLVTFPNAYNTEEFKADTKNKVRYSYYVTKALNSAVDETATQVFYLDDMQLSKVPAGKRP